MTSGYRDPTLSPIEDPTQLEELFPRCTPKTTPTNTPSARKANKTLLSDGSNPDKKSTEKKRRTKKKGTKKTTHPPVAPVAPVALVGDVAVDNILDLNFSHETLPNVMAVRPSPLGLGNHNVNMVLSPTTTPPSWQMSQLGETKIPNPHGGSVSSLEPQTSAPNFPASQSKLKDTKIEIAGGREVYSQSRSRVGRNKNRGESKRVPPPVIDILSGDDSSSNHGQHDAQNKNRVKETVFSSEVHSFEYDKPEAEVPRRRSYETDVDGNSVVYPNLCGLDVNVTYDLIDGEFPPPSGLTVRPGDESIIGKNGSECMDDPTPASQGDPSMSLDLLSQSPPPPPLARQSGSEGRHSRSGESPSQHVSRGNGGSKGHMGGIAIDEYEGSPSRYRPRFDGDMMEQQTPMSQSDSRPSTNSVVAPMAHQDSRESIHRPESSSNSTLSTPSSSVSGKVQKARKRAPNNHCGGKLSSPQTTVVPMSSNSGGHVMASSRLPGFPQRVLPATSDTQSTPSSSSSKEESPLSDHKSSIGAAQSSPSSSSTSSSKSNTSKRQRRDTSSNKTSSDLYNYQYEFSETRKVLDEFFPETRIPSSTSNISYQNSTLEKTTPPPSEFRDLNYTLRRRTSPEATSTENEPFTREGQDLSGNESGGNQPTGTAFLNSIQQPHVGLSPLDQPLVNIGNGGSIQGSENQAASPGLMKIQRNATVQPLAQQQHQHPQLGGGNNSHNCDTGYATLNSPEAASRISHPPKGAPHHGFHRGSDAAFGGNGGNGGQTNNCDCSRNFTLSPETTDCDSADLESEVSMNEGSFHSSGPRLHTAMPILEDGLSSGHASDLEEDVIYSSSGSMVLKKSSPSNSNNAHLNNGHVINSSEFAVNSPSGATTTTTTTSTTIVPTVTTPTSNPLATTATASNNLGVKGAKNQTKVVNRNGIVKGQINADSNPTVMVSNLQIQRSPTAASHQAHPPPQVVSGEMGWVKTKPRTGPWWQPCKTLKWPYNHQKPRIHMTDMA
ncbi:hypothetical protein TCAL_05932 [Tigriopus californicus]|uniref:Uncharacterized protein n=1 Tax=Tigriopus californicus TaxID=6832 RepID=A0A553NZT2_TIGCA|nr:hypothetical protein TCAL_05932 [Tigriopus californicus]